MSASHTIDTLHARCDEVGDCWIWRGNRGVPKINLHGQSVPARRALREMVDQMATRPGMRVTATCGDRRCISPLCSYAATPSDTCQAASRRGAYDLPAARAKAAITARARSHITDELVRHVRSATGTHQQIADAAGMSRSHVSAIRGHRSRKDYRNPFAGLQAGATKARA